MTRSHRAGRYWLPTLIFLMSAGCAVAATPPPASHAARIQGSVERFGQWYVGCNNLGSCSAITPLGDASVLEETPILLMIFTPRIADAQTVAIMRGNAMINGLSPLAAHQLTEALLDSNAGHAAYEPDKSVGYQVPRGGFAEVMQALAKWRAMPPQLLPSTETVTPLPAPRIDSPVVHPALRNIAKRCPEGHMGASIQAWRGLDGSTLWRVGCGNEGLNSVSFWFVSGPQGDPPAPIRFEDSGRPAQPFNSWFDEATGYLRMTHFFGRWDSYAEDCGIYRAYGWGVGGMKLVERRFMPVCGTGIGPEGWITTFRATVFNAPDSRP